MEMKRKIYLISKRWWKAEAEATLNMFRWGVVLRVDEYDWDDDYLEVTMGVTPGHEADLEDYIEPYV